jgi:hypothetical protein
VSETEEEQAAAKRAVNSAAEVPSSFQEGFLIMDFQSGLRVLGGLFHRLCPALMKVS